MRKKIAGIAGHPPEPELEKLRDSGYGILDLDIPRPGVPASGADPLLPRVYCAVLRTVAANALAFRPVRIVADVGEGKCDGMRLLSGILKDAGFDVVMTRNRNMQGGGYPICVSAYPLRKKIDAITSRLATGRRLKPRPAEALAGYWGVPPADPNLLDLFPENTHVFGWTRCLENGTPADLGLEREVNPGLPTVFYAQSFCQKNALARHLAALCNGLYIEAADRITRADRAKVEAFFEMNLGKKRKNTR